MEQARSRTPGQGAGAPVRSGDALAALRLAWGAAYEFGHDGRGYWARRRGGDDVITASGPDRLLNRVRDDHIASSEAGRAAAIAAIEAEFDAWRVWVSDRGHWYAVRQGAAGRYERGVSGPITLDAADAAGLRAELALAAEAALAALAGLAGLAAAS